MIILLITFSKIISDRIATITVDDSIENVSENEK